MKVAASPSIADAWIVRHAQVDELEVLDDIDTDASVLFDQAGIHLELPEDHEFVVAERRRWLQCLRADSVLLALDRNKAVGFIALDVLDGEPYVAQLSVRQSSMRRGLGSRLLNEAYRRIGDKRGNTLWLTTYRHLPWNRPFYERHGFVVIAEHECGDELRRVSHYERRWLPLPEQRIVMRKQIRSVELA